MSDVKKFMQRLQKMEGAVTEQRNIHEKVIRSQSPSFNYIFGKGHGLPRGASMLLYGPAKSGKSILCNSMIGQLHADDPTAFAVKFNTEFREEGQNSQEAASLFGIDPDRYIGFDVSEPALIFDRIEHDLNALCQEGMNLGLVIIDSLAGIQGRRSMNADSVTQQQMADHAATIQDGLKRILPIHKRRRFALIGTTHVRQQFDAKQAAPGVVHTGQTTALRPAAANAAFHHFEYFAYVNRAGGADGRQDLLGNSFEDESVKDLNDNGEKTGHKIRCRMIDSSYGSAGRNGLLTFDYKRGIINQHEEVFSLGVNYGIIEKPSNVTYVYNGTSYKGKAAMLEACKSKEVQDAICKALRDRDMGNGQPLPKLNVPSEDLE